MTDANSETADSLPLEFLQLPKTCGASIDEDVALSEPNEVFVCQIASSENRLYYRGRILGESRGHSINQLGDARRQMTSRERLRMSLLRNEDDAPPSIMSSHNVRSVPGLHKDVRPQCPDSVRNHGEMHPQVKNSCPRFSKVVPEAKVSPVCFATHTTFGVLDLGASKTVIGAEHVKSLICSLDQSLRNRLTRCKCQITFRFGNQGTLTSDQALVVPVGDLMLKIAVVPGSTPFLISNTLMRALQAQIDCDAFLLRSPKLMQPVRMELTNKGLFLIDLNELARASKSPKSLQPAAKSAVETFTTTACHDENATEAAEGRKGQHGFPAENPSMPLSETQEPRDGVRTCSFESDVQNSNKHVAVNTSLAQERSPTNCDNAARAEPSRHVLEPAPERNSVQSRAITERLGTSDPSGVGDRDGGLRQEELRTQLPGSLELRPGVGLSWWIVMGRATICPTASFSGTRNSWCSTTKRTRCP